MLFTSLQYLLFLPLTVALYWLLPKKFRLPMMLAASWYFYMSWCTPMVLLIIGTTVFNFFWGKLVYKSTDKAKRTIFGLGVAANLLCLGVFKYANFAVSSTSGIVGALSGHNPHWSTHILLPLAISFFTFEFIHYLFDIYRGNKPVDSFVMFALFAAFFPTQIAGPIKRYPQFIQQMTGYKPFDLALFDRGIQLIIIGFAKKVLVADTLSVIVNMVLSEPGSYGSLELWIMAYAFTFQIYFDFSAYTDIARGSAMLFSYEIPLNFNMPFIARNISEFWSKRWHISLSNWLRDYLFIPLGGSRGGRWKTHRNMFITMVLGGLWHGAAWNFVVWGMFHGVALIVHREFADWRKTLGSFSKVFEGRAFELFSIILTFHTFCIGQVIFRVENIETGFRILKNMFTWKHVFSPHSNGQLFITRPELPIIAPIAVILLIVLMLQNLPISALAERGYFARVPAPIKATFLWGLVVAMIVFLPSSTQPFIYFQF